MENVPPLNNNPNVHEEEPIMDQAPAALVGFAPQWIGAQILNNNNGWLEEDPDEDEEEDPKEVPEEEEIEDKNMVNNKDDEGNEEDDAEVINPYEEVDPHNRLPPTTDEETKFASPVVQIADADDVPIPPVIQFGKKKMARKLKQDELHMNGQEFDITALDSTVRENRFKNSKMTKMITGLSRDFIEIKIQNRGAEELSHWEAWVRGRIPNNLRFQEEPSIYTALVPRADDPYVMVATLGREVANGRPWTEVKQMMTDEFCPTEEVQRFEDELRHLKLRDMNIAAYKERFNKLALLSHDVVPN
uniref:Retrotransposon gag domain-containing protein n=1 Tax=Tanacetum cinerariifolium TaxID=118510 RepID=A0A699KA95_TANCI|nr:hypothetical protein [Tanacetum cinerariifolium]